MNSLTQRLNIGLGLSLILLMGLIGWLIYDQNKRLGDDLIVSRLQHDGEGLLAALQFDAEGKKTANAKFLKIELNGKILHENVELKGSTGGALRNKEVARGPIMFQGDHGAVAFRNLKITEGE